jgi:hypothetical protein
MYGRKDRSVGELRNLCIGKRVLSQLRLASGPADSAAWIGPASS